MEAVLTPIDTYLARQRAGTAVEQFAQRHDAGFGGPTGDLLSPDERWYADRLPIAKPGIGQQYAFQVDLDQCTGCKACVAACHSLNGLDEGESWRSAGQLVSIGAGPSRQQTVPSGCHHCLEPACLAGCPTNAYEKDPITGIVRHLDDQCIGCGYCELTCPYEVPSFNERLGIVRKCDMCTDRLAVGEAPACVQACPTSAITIALVDVDEVRTRSIQGQLVPGAPASATTAPTTRYVSSRPLDDSTLVAADRHAIHLSKGHPPLAFMLVVTQLSVGALVTAVAARALPGGVPAAGPIAAALAGVVALAASVLHLGRPLVAWRAVLGIGHSWLSREIVAFGAYAALAVGYGAAEVVGIEGPPSVGLGAVGAAVGIGGVACSALIYVTTRRQWWRMRHTGVKFALSGLVTGPLLVVAVTAPAALADPAGPDAVLPVVLAVVVLVSTVAKLVAEAAFLNAVNGPDDNDAWRTAHLLVDRLATHTRWRFGLGIVGGLAAPVVIILASTATDPSGPAVAIVAVGGLVLAVAGEMIERWQFFVACVTPRMPGVFRP